MMYLLMAAVLLVFVLLNYYIGIRLLAWIRVLFQNVNKKAFRLIYIGIIVLMILGFALPQVGIIKVLHTLSNYWIGLFAYSLLVLFLIDLLRFIGKYTKVISKDFLKSPRVLRVTGFVAILTVSGFMVYGSFHAGHLTTVNYPVAIDKPCKENPLTVVLVSDIHINQDTKISKLEAIVEEINKNNADVVIIAGDLMDNRKVQSPEEIKKVFRSIKSKYGVYACLGNHDVNFSLKNKGQNEGKDPVVDFFSELGITLLKDEIMLVENDFYIAGRLDPHPIAIEQGERKTISELLSGVDLSKPMFLLDHQPTQIAEAKENGVDLLLSGHTHRGQIFPGNLMIKALFENAYGYLKRGDLHSIVTSGAGTWGPDLRIGTDCEIVRIEVSFI